MGQGQAAADGDNDAVEALLTEGAEPSVALILALEGGRADAVQPLLDEGADPSSRDIDGTPAVVLAAKRGDTGSVRALTNGLSTQDVMDANGRTALMWAVVNGNEEVVELLVDAGAKTDIEDLNGNTALALAGAAGQTEIARLLRICRIGQELSPGQSCDVPGAGTFSVRSDGCVGTQPVVTGPVSMGTFEFRILDGERFSCIRGHFGRGGFRASEVSDTSHWRIDALP